MKQQYSSRLHYENVLDYGFENDRYYEWKHERALASDEYIAYTRTYCEYITLERPYKTALYTGGKNAVLECSDKIAVIDTIPLYLVQTTIVPSFNSFRYLNYKR